MNITEIAPDVFRLSTFVPEINLQFNQFLVIDDEPLLFHTGQRALFSQVKEGVATLIDPSKIRWIGFSHFEADECGSLNEWLEVAPDAQPVCTLIGALVSINDFASRSAKGMNDGEVLSTGKYNFRLLHTPHVPHCWEAGLLFEEVNKTLFSSDLIHQNGDVEPLTENDVIERVRQTLVEYQASPLANYMPYGSHTESSLKRLAELNAETIATMHGSAYKGNGATAIRNLAVVMKEVLGG